MSEQIIEVKHLSKSFGDHEVLRDVDFTVAPGDVTSIIGAAVNIGLNLVLLNSPLGVIGAAVATLACYLLVYIIRAIDTRQFLTVNVDYLKMAINIMLISTMSVCIMTLDEGLLLNVLDCILFIILCAINFKTAAQAVKLFIRRRTGRGGNPEDGAEKADNADK